MKSDIEIARSVRMRRITEIADNIGIPEEKVAQYGHYMAKVPLSLINEDKVAKSKLVLVTAITATKAGIGKTTVSVGLALGLNKIGKKAIVALREPSLGPCFGMKGGAAGGGWAQVLPMEKINLHFTGDMHAVTSAHNMISALPAWSKSCALVELNASYNKLTSVSALRGLAALNYVNLDHNKLSNINPLADCRMLVRVSVFGNYVKDVSKLTEMSVIVNYDPT